MFAIHARIAFLPVVKGGFGNPKVSAYDLGLFASFVILEGMYDLAFGESGCFHRLNKVKVFPFLISPKFGEGYTLTHNGFGLGEGGDFHHKYSYEARMFKSTKNAHTKH
jgi:hypothetical protein